MESTIARPQHLADERPPHALRSLRHETRQTLIRTEAHIREHPRQATFIGLGAGFLLSFLPLTFVVTAALRLGLLLAKPLLLILGGVKIVEEYRKSHPHAP